jgi:hypothetical protein
MKKFILWFILFLWFGTSDASADYYICKDSQNVIRFSSDSDCWFEQSIVEGYLWFGLVSPLVNVWTFKNDSYITIDLNSSYITDFNNFGTDGPHSWELKIYSDEFANLWVKLNDAPYTALSLDQAIILITDNSSNINNNPYSNYYLYTAPVLNNSDIIITSTWLVLNSWYFTVITDANSAFLSTSFQVVKLLPYIAVIAWGFYLLNKVFGIIPRSWN